YSQPLAEIANELGPHGVSFIGLTTNQDETPGDVLKLGKDFDLPFPLFLDKKLIAADAVAARITPEVFVLDGDYVLRYRGRIDDWNNARLKKNQQTTEYDLRQALAEIMSGRPVSTPATEAIGCVIVREAKAAPAAEPSPPAPLPRAEGREKLT